MSDELVRREDAALEVLKLKKWGPVSSFESPFDDAAAAIRALPPVVPPEASERQEGE